MERVHFPIVPAERSYTVVTLQPCDLARHVSHLVNLVVDLLQEVPNPRLKKLPVEDRPSVELLRECGLTKDASRVRALEEEMQSI
jgi:hypothetical protein